MFPGKQVCIMTEKMKLALEKYSQNEALQKEIEKNPPKSVEDVIALGKRLGVELSAADFEFGKDMTEAELDQVAGGIGKSTVKKQCGNLNYACCVLGVGCMHYIPKPS